MLLINLFGILSNRHFCHLYFHLLDNYTWCALKTSMHQLTNNTRHRTCIVSSCWLKTAHLVFATGNDWHVYSHLEQESEIRSQVVTRYACGDNARYEQTSVLITQYTCEYQMWTELLSDTNTPTCCVHHHHRQIHHKPVYKLHNTASLLRRNNLG